MFNHNKAAIFIYKGVIILSEVSKKEVTRVETHQITKYHNLFDFCDRKCYESKNFYNSTNYVLRQRFTEQEGYKKDNFTASYYSISKEFRKSKDAEPLASNFIEGIAKVLSQDWKSFFKSIKDWSKNKHKYKGKPNLPGYAPTGETGRKVAIDRRINRRKDGTFKFAGEKVYFKPQTDHELKQARIVPKPNGENTEYYNIEIVYKKEIPEEKEEVKKIASIDLGINNFATVVNNFGVKPFAINGKPIKSMNRYYNKKKAKLMSYIGGKGTSNRLRKLDRKRKNKIKTYMHQSSRKVIDWCVDNNVDTLIIGKNKDWKNEINIGKVNNQKFVSIPFGIFIDQLLYKAKDVGIKAETVEESYTSKASFLDKDEIPKYKKGDDTKHSFSGRRVQRGLYKSFDGTLVNADVNGAYNIMRKKYEDKINCKIEKEALLHPEIVNVGGR